MENQIAPPLSRALRRLTPAQFRVVALLFHDELDYPRIAARLMIQVRTVRMHIEYVARELPGHGPPAWKVLRYAEDLLEMGFEDADVDAMPRAS